MLSENIRAIRESRGLSQEELAAKLNVVRQTISKWERGLSVPDADMLTSLSEALGVPVSALLEEGIADSMPKDAQPLAQKLEAVGLQLARTEEVHRKVARCALVAICVLTVLVFAGLASMGSSYLAWDFTDPETAVAGTALHAFEWAFVRAAPLVLIGAAAGLVMMRKRG